MRAGLSSMVTFAPDGSVKNCTVLSEPGFTTTLGGLVETSCLGCGWSRAGSAGVASGGLAVADCVVSGLVAAGGLGGSTVVVSSGGRDSPTGLGLDEACSGGRAAV